MSILDQPFSLHNVGNLCYLNSWIQSVLSCKPFTNILEEIEKSPSRYEKSNELVKAMVDGHKNKSPTMSGNVYYALLSMMKKKGAKFNFIAGQQEDASEVFHLIIDMMENKKFEELFRIKIGVIIYCVKKNQRISEKQDLVLQIDIPIPDNQLSEKEWNKYIEKFLKVNKEVLNPSKGKNGTTEGIICKACKEYHDLNRITYIDYINSIIVICFLKYNKKTDSYYPKNFKLIAEDDQEIVFEAVSQIDHFGDQSGGHYTATVKRNDKNYLCNDGQINLKDDIIPDKNTYMVFYSRVL